MKFFLIFAMLAIPVRAQEAEPVPMVFGGCFAHGLWCVHPDVSLTLTAINLTKGKIEASFDPGLGLGITWSPGKWYSLGAVASLKIDPGTNHAFYSGGLALLNGWGRVVYSRGFLGDDKDARVALGLGLPAVRF